jgi:hypothetical protein
VNISLNGLQRSAAINFNNLVKKANEEDFDIDDIKKAITELREDIAMFVCVIDPDTNNYCDMQIDEITDDLTG